MILCDSEIFAALRNEQVIIKPVPPPEHVSPTAVDLTLGNEFKRWQPPPGDSIQMTVDPSARNFLADCERFCEPVTPDADGSVVIAPGEFMLARTAERIELPITSRIAARVEGRSGLARLGLGVHVTAPTIHASFKGTITLELKNEGDLHIRLRPGLRVCQLILEMAFGTPSRELASVFQNQSTVLGVDSPPAS